MKLTVVSKRIPHDGSLAYWLQVRSFEGEVIVFEVGSRQAAIALRSAIAAGASRFFVQGVQDPIAA